MKHNKLFDFEKRRGFASITGLDGLGSYAMAYWKAARGMVDHRLFEGSGRPDFTVFPIVFLYRHALELLLKSILVEHHEKYSQHPESLLGGRDRGHQLISDYLTDLRAIVDKVGVLPTGQPVIDITSAQWTNLENVLSEWQKYDPDGMAFRYSIDRKAKRPLIDADFTFDVEQFSAAMENVLEILASLKAELFQWWYRDFLEREGLVDDSTDRNLSDN